MLSLVNIIVAFLAAINLVSAETHTWYYNTTWVMANPDGVKERPVMGFNNTWPLPDFRVKKGDTINLYLTNGFDDRNTSLHFHGLFQNGTNQMDGPEMVTQCPIPPGETFLYNFSVPDQSGSFWYHSHTSGQYQDGMRGAFIIEDDDYPYEYDEEVILSIGEWYHETTDVLIPGFLNRYNPTGAEPIPQNLLMNNTMNNTWHVEPNKTYLLRIINVGGFVSQYLWMEDHEFTVVEVDGITVERNTTDMIYITVAQRYACLVTTKNDTSRNYAFMQKFDEDMLDTEPADLRINVTNWIVYDDEEELPGEYYVDEFDFLDDFYLVPTEPVEAYDDPDYQVVIDVVMDNLGNGVNYAFFNNLTYTPPKVPTLHTVLSAGEDASNVLVYGENTHSYVLQKDDIVEIVLNNQDTGKHPFHLHGHTFQVMERAAGVDDADPPMAYNSSDHAPFPEFPMRRDTFYVNPQSYFVIRFKADNPGVWFFHCHIEWHLEQGLAIVLIEGPNDIQNTITQQLTPDSIRACTGNNASYIGNAAGNSVNFLDLSGQNVQHPPLPAGFTARGIVALVFSCLAGFLGIAAIAWYGAQDIKDVEQRVVRDLMVDLDEDDEAELTSQTGVEGSSK